MPDQEKSAATAITRSGVTRPRERFGAGRIIGETFSVMSSNVLAFALVTPVLALAAYVLQQSVFTLSRFAWLLVLFDGASGYLLAEYGLPFAALAGCTLVIAGYLVQPVSDHRSSRTRSGFLAISRSFVQTLPRLLACSVVLATGMMIVILCISYLENSLTVIMIQFGINSGNIFLVLLFAIFATVFPAFFLFCCVPAAIVEENLRFGSFRRSMRLTRGYRWPCLGIAVLITIIAELLTRIVAAVLAILDIGFNLSDHIVTFTSFWWYSALFGIAGSLIYFRLREIKEGAIVEQNEDVFA